MFKSPFLPRGDLSGSSRGFFYQPAALSRGGVSSFANRACHKSGNGKTQKG